jgi:hypothetical protein
MAEYYKNAAAATKDVVKASAGRVYSLRATNTNAAARYIQLHNKATAPAAADTALRSWVIPAGSAAAPAVLELGPDYFAPEGYISLGTGIGFAISTTDTTFTDSATAAEHRIEINYT